MFGGPLVFRKLRQLRHYFYEWRTGAHMIYTPEDCPLHDDLYPAIELGGIEFCNECAAPIVIALYNQSRETK